MKKSCILYSSLYSKLPLAYVVLLLSGAQDLRSNASEKIDGDVTALEDKLSTVGDKIEDGYRGYCSLLQQDLVVWAAVLDS